MGDHRTSFVVMTHPRRMEYAKALADDNADMNIEIVVDPDPDGVPTSSRTARAAWAAASADVTHHVVLQDDVVLCAGFATAVAKAIDAHPDKSLSFFAPSGGKSAYAARVAAIRGRSWAEVVGDYVPAQALALPAEAARELARFMGRHPIEHPDDIMVKRFVDATGLDALVSMPNLVDHRDVVSLVGNHQLGQRPSVSFDRAGAAAADWRCAPSRCAVVPYLPWYRPEALALVRTESGGALAEPALRFMAGAGIDSETLLARGREEIASLDTPAELRDQVEDSLLTELWIAAFLLGVAAWYEWPSSENGFDVDSEPTRAALATMASGAVRGYVSRQSLPLLDRWLAPLVMSGVLAGLDNAVS